MVKIAICDDEELVLGQLKAVVTEILTQWKEDFGITCFSGPHRLLLSPMEFDLIFLDIQMPMMDGMALARKLREKGFEGILIFVTVLEEYMSAAFEVEAMDYLIKPIDKERLKAALKRSLKRLGGKGGKCLFIRTKTWCRTVRLHDIYYCEVIDRKIYVHTRDGVLDYYGKIRDVERQTQSALIRCHRSYLINPEYLLEYRGGLAVLENGEKVPVAHSCHQAVMEQMMRYMGEG
ncbi:MAG: response regulator transcription factor [Hungatella sp.]|nr:response regulator transcription factor [Hungatella sp.]